MSARFTQVDNKILEHWLPLVGQRGAMIYWYVCYRSNRRRGTWCTESLDRIAKRLGVRRQTVQRLLRQLVDMGALECVRRKHAPVKYRPIYPLPNPQQVQNGLPQQVQSGLPKSSHQVPFVMEVEQTGPTNNSSNKRTKVPTSVDNGSAAKRLVTRFKKLWESEYGESYAPDWGKDIKMMKRKLEQIPEEQLEQKMDRFFGWWQTHWQSEKGTRRPKIGEFMGNVERIQLSRRVALPTGTPRSEL